MVQQAQERLPACGAQLSPSPQAGCSIDCPAPPHLADAAHHGQQQRLLHVLVPVDLRGRGKGAGLDALSGWGGLLIICLHAGAGMMCCGPAATTSAPQQAGACLGRNGAGQAAVDVALLRHGLDGRPLLLAQAHLLLGVSMSRASNQARCLAWAAECHGCPAFNRQCHALRSCFTHTPSPGSEHCPTW